MPNVDLDALSSDDLAAILDTVQEDGSVTLPDAPAPVAPVEAEPPPEEVAAPESASEPVEAEPAREPETDWKAEAEKLRADLEKQQQHGARLAGEIGYLKGRLTSGAPAGDAMSEPAADLPGEDYSDVARNEVAALASQVQELQAREARREQERLVAVDHRLAAEAKRLLIAVEDDIRKEVLAANQDAILAVEQEYDPERREQRGREVVQRLSIEASSLQMGRQRERMAAQKTASTAASQAMKRAATVSGSGGVPTPPPRPRTAADMSAAEADQWLKENVR